MSKGLQVGSGCPTNMCPGILREAMATDEGVVVLLECRDCRKFFDVGAEID